jgi:2-polyprenyl-3-methyl-5-hydroxy-6-metoxy-1,4-benzoquinol methylase
MENKYLIINAIRCLRLKLNGLNPQNLNISENTREYLLKYKNNYSYYMSAYSQLLQKALQKINKSVDECIFVDYGGGCGILSLLAKLAGFRIVIYNDLYKRSLTDAKIISKELNIPVDYYICGDAEDFVDQIERLNIEPDLICSFNVLEHIYNLESWIKTISKIQNFSLLFMTTANPRNPFIANRIKKLHKISEYQGGEKNIRLNDIYLNTSFLKQRETIIRNMFPDLNNIEVELLSRTSRGLRSDDIEKMVREYLETGETTYNIDHKTNTCDPYTGSWTEKLIDLKRLKKFCSGNNLLTDLTSSYYCYSNNKAKNTFKFLMNQLIKIVGPKNLFLSPAITIEIQKRPW